jgi:hypothetical protein
MKQRPNISVHKNSKLINYVREKVLSDISGTYQSGSAQDFNNDLQLHNDLVRNNPLPSTQFIPKGKTKSKPNIKLIKRDVAKTNQFRIDMLNYANREFGINPDLLIEHSTYYVLTIISYKLITNNEQPTVKDFDIYCNGLKVDSVTTSVNVGENIVITIQKSEAVDDTFDTNNFEIVSKFDWINVTNEEDFDLITENGEDIII